MTKHRFTNPLTGVTQTIDYGDATSTLPRPFLLLAELKLTDLPQIGQEWPGQGGVFAGLVRGRDGAPDTLMLLGPEHDSELNWQAATDWAASLEIEGHKDFYLPSRAEHSILFGNVVNQFNPTIYWSSTQHAEGAVYAWAKGFYDGYQDYYRKGDKWRARAVRRLIIQ